VNWRFSKVRYRSIEPVEDIAAIDELRDLQPIEAANIYDPDVTATPIVE